MTHFIPPYQRPVQPPIKDGCTITDPKWGRSVSGEETQSTFQSIFKRQPKQGVQSAPAPKKQPEQGVQLELEEFEPAEIEKSQVELHKSFRRGLKDTNDYIY